jgi:hypothetical protein
MEDDEMKTVKFYTLLYIDTENQSLSRNFRSGTFDGQMKTFIRCCEALNKSLISFTNYELIVLTNNKAYIENVSKELRCVEIEFDFEVPKGIRFFASHHKIDVFKYLAGLSDSDYSFLLDSDVLCINKMPLNLINCINNNIPVYYDITEQSYPAYGRETMIKDKEVLMSNILSTGIWAGGEFIGGDNEFFKLLHDEIGLIRENYLANYRSLHHQGDEALTSAAIETIMRKKYVCNAGLFGGIGRYWGVPTLHVQNHWKSYLNNFLLHLPADKDFIAAIGSIDGRLSKTCKKRFRHNARMIVLKRIVKSIVKR